MRASYHSAAGAVPFWILGSYLIIPPALFLFVKTNTRPNFQYNSKAKFLFLPAIIEITAELFSFYSNQFFGTSYDLMSIKVWYVFTEIVPVCAMILVLVFFGNELINLYRQLKKIPVKNGGRFQIHRLTTFFAVFSSLTLLWLLIALFDVQIFTVIEIALLVFLFVLGYISYFKPSFFDIPKILKPQLVKDKYPQYDDETELKRLTTLFEEDKIYTTQKLSIKEVASGMNLPERYVSQLINSYHNVSFNSYVNSFRVKDAMQRINDPSESHKTLLAIAMESGFNSKSSFNQIFKNTTGKNPSDFLEK